MYPAFLGTKLWLKLNTPVGRLANVSALELTEEPYKMRALLTMPHPHNPATLRAEVNRLLAEGAPDAASRLLAELWRREPGSATASFVTSRVDQLRDKLRSLDSS